MNDISSTVEGDALPLGLDEAARYTGLSKSYLYKLTSRKEIPYYKPRGGRLVFKRSDLERFMFRNRHAAPWELEERADAILNRRGGLSHGARGKPRRHGPELPRGDQARPLAPSLQCSAFWIGWNINNVQ